jgi:predicted Zn-dependent peptidase
MDCTFGSQLNAFTEKEYIGYYAKVLYAHLPIAFDLLSDKVPHPAFPPEDVGRERNVIFEEINIVEDSPQGLILDLFLESFWKKHPLGHPISGASTGKLFQLEFLPILCNTAPAYICAISLMFCLTWCKA